MEAAYAIPRNSASWKPRSPEFAGGPTTAMATGSIMIVVAVLETHMLATAAASMNAATTRGASVPTARTVASANRLCRSQRSVVAARKKPPRKRKMMGSA
jgi:hypothetical protein